MFDSRWLRVARSVGAGSEFPVGEREPEGRAGRRHSSKFVGFTSIAVGARQISTRW